ncbi:hypothetical protein ABIA55_000290 [Pseudomonas frederiksbergensis]|jgi:hypothetical protein
MPNITPEASVNPVARELAPAGLRSNPKTRRCIYFRKARLAYLRLLRSRAGASSLATIMGVSQAWVSRVTRIRPRGPYVVGFAGLHDGRL